MMKDEDNKPEEKSPEEQHERHLNKPQDDREEETERRYMQRLRNNERKPSTSHWGYKNWPAAEQNETPENEKTHPDAEQETRALLKNDDDREHSPTSTGKIPGPGNAEEDRDDEVK